MAARAVELAGLYVSEKGRLGRLINRIVGNSATAEDLVQDTFVNVLGAPQSREIRDDKAYLSQVARNLAIDHTRKDRRLVDLKEEDFFALVDPSPSPEAVAADRQALAITMQAMAHLPERTRKALEMHRLGDHTLAQIGKFLGISTSLAGRLVLDGYRVVRDRLQEAGAV
jgi:RNA polymerase sigma-70 factor (ECF subfamily)